MRGVFVVLLCLTATTVYAEPLDDLKACQAQLRLVSARAEDEQNFVILHLTRLLLQRTAQVEELQRRLQAMQAKPPVQAAPTPKPAEKK